MSGAAADRLRLQLVQRIYDRSKAALAIITQDGPE
jgi:hypothetical protein